jgi:hypothetical protein
MSVNPVGGDAAWPRLATLIGWHGGDHDRTGVDDVFARPPNGLAMSPGVVRSVKWQSVLRVRLSLPAGETAAGIWMLFDLC